MADTILIVDDEQIIRESASFILRKEGFTVEEAPNGRAAYEMCIERAFDLVITDLEMPEMKGIELLAKIRELSPQTIVIIITAYGSLETAISALRMGASDYLLKPIEFDELTMKIRRLLEHRKLLWENQYLRREVNRGVDFKNLIGQSPAMQRVFNTVKQISATEGTVLITGRSGTGKEMVARAVHANSPRADKPFVAVNCGAIPETLIESELFGHKKGSFTGAVSDRGGYFKAADGGTLLLDEISEMPVQLQVKLLRAIDQKEIVPVGMSMPESVDVRFIATTNRELRQEIEEGRFREDLFYRLNIVEIRLPSLSERKEDIPVLVNYFLDKFSMEMGKKLKGFEPEVMRLLIGHQWRGEVRELENIIERAVIFARGETISIIDLPEAFQNYPSVPSPLEDKSLDQVVNDLAKDYIVAVLRKHQFDKEKTAKSLKISLPTLYRRIKELGIATENKPE
ncbi:MAG TPA: sigma-54 dependent transcriptional regulator [Bacteroidota bacterium]|nr:sigma-54 dependent transcriptional regulator [Bacteroidota bacterium]